MLPKRPGNAGQYLRVLKFASLIGVVVAHVGTAVAAGDAEVDQQLGNRLEVIDVLSMQEPVARCRGWRACRR